MEHWMGQGAEGFLSGVSLGADDTETSVVG